MYSYTVLPYQQTKSHKMAQGMPVDATLAILQSKSFQ
jgi:hypothetical protein